MLIAVVSDTHGHVTNTLDAIRLLDGFAVEAVLHCGDIGSPEIPPLFSKWPAHFVFGNVDGDEAELQAAIEQAGHVCHGRFGEIELAGRKIALLHGDDGRKLHEVINSAEYDLVCSGHTHQRKHEQQGKTVILNPGAVYRARPHTVAVVELETLEVTSLVI